jgi:acyl-CoA synthetase (AMP-forming)/AMP-acid ligase II
VLTELVRRIATTDPDRPLLLALGRSVTYAEGLARAERIAAGLDAAGAARFAIAATDALEILPLLIGAARVGAEACVYPYLLDAGEVDEYAARFGHPLVVSGRDLPGLTTPAIGVGELATGSAALPPQPERCPLLILTTGTTGTPKGARHDWARLAAGVRRRSDGAGERWLLAYNLNQFAGIQVVLHAVTVGATLVVPPANQPRVAIDIIRDLGVTHASATPTFWRFAATLLDAEGAAGLPLRQVTLGGEAVPAPLLDRLGELFPTARISQVYASTEFGSTVSVRDGVNGLPLSVLDRGEGDDVAFRIVDGELHVRSRVGMVGYHDQDDVADEWRPTGDLVEVRGDRIEFVGRTSEIINVGGVKVHPLPIEEVISAVPGVDVVRVSGKKNPVTGQIVVAEVVAAAGADVEALEDAIRDACAELPPASQPRRVRFVESIALRENKVVRAGGGE